MCSITWVIINLANAADLNQPQQHIIAEQEKTESIGTTHKSYEHTRKQFNENNQPLNGTAAQILYDRKPGRKYFIENTYDPYEPVIQVAFNTF